jgi:hypothetical protein
LNCALFDVNEYVKAHLEYDGKTPLKTAIELGAWNGVAILLCLGTDLGKVDNEGNGPFHWAAKQCVLLSLVQCNLVIAANTRASSKDCSCSRRQ